MRVIISKTCGPTVNTLKRFVSINILLCLGCISSAVEIALTENGGMTIDNIALALELHDMSNQVTGSKSKLFQLRQPLKTENGISSICYSLAIPGGASPGDLSLSLKKEADHSFRFDGQLLLEQPTKFKGLCLQGWIPTSCYKKVSYEIDGKTIRFPEEWNGSRLFEGQVKRFRLPTTNGELLLEGDFYLRISDLRKWQSSFQLKIGFLPRQEELRRAGMKFAVRYGKSGAFGGVLGNVNLPAFIVKEGADWKAYRYHNSVEPGSALDFSAWLDAPAGKYGQVISKNGQFYFQKRPGIPVRFYGPNLVDSTQFPTKEQAEEIANSLAAFGFNAVRIHHHDHLIFDRKAPGRFDEERFDRLDYLLACLKERGIYYTTDIYVSRRNIPGSDVGLSHDIKNPSEYKARIYIDDNVLNDWKRWATGFLGHVNPYTGVALKDDPALLSLCLVNEGNPGRQIFRYPEVEKMYRARYEEWKKTHPDIGFYEFIAVVAKERFDEMKKFLRDMGCKALLTDQNYCHEINLTDDRAHYDFVDTHMYWDVPFFEENYYQPPARMSQLNHITSKPGLTGELFPTRLLGQPFTVTEFSFCYPNQFRAAGPALIGAYGALQDWSGMFPFAFSHNICVWNNPPRSVNAFLDILSDPIKMLSHRIGTHLFLNGGVKPAQTVIASVVTEPYGQDYMKRFSDSFSELGFLARIGSVSHFPVAGKVDAYIDMGTGVPPKKEKTPVVKDSLDLIPQLIYAGFLPKNCYDGKNGIMSADHGRLEISRKHSTFKAVTPNNEVLIMKAGTTLTGKYMSVENKDTFATFALLPVDNHYLANAKRLTLFHLTNSLESGMRFANDQMERLDAWGKMPFLAKHGRAGITLQIPDIDRIYALDMAGKRIGELPFTRKGNGAMIAIDNFRFSEAVFAYEIVRK